MQFSADTMLFYIGCSTGKTENGDFYRITFADGEGKTLTLYSDAVIYGRCQGLKQFAEVQPVLDIYGRSSGGIGARLSDFTQASRG